MRARWVGVSLVVFVIAGAGLLALRPRAPSVAPEIEATASAVRARLAKLEGGEALSEAEANRRAIAEDRAGRGALAWDLLASSAAQGAPSVELRLAIHSLRVPAPGKMSREEALALIAVVGAEHPDEPLLPAARAWGLLAQDQPAQALQAAEGDPGTPEGALARLRGALALGQPTTPAAEALLALDPADGEACAALGRSALAEGALASLLERARACQAAGARDPALARAIGDALDVAGRPAEALPVYVSAGLHLHAAAIVLQEGLADPGGSVEAALADPAPPAALTRVWTGLLRGEPTLAAEGASRLTDAGFPGPEAVIARAAAAIANGDPAVALRLLSGLSSPAAGTLRGRAAALVGDQDAAAGGFAEALRGAPTQPAVHRERLAWLADRPSEQRLAAARALAEADPISLTLASTSRERDAPWAAVAPSAWPALPPDQPEGALLAAVLQPLAPPAGVAPLSGDDLALAQLHRAWALALAGDRVEGRRLADAAALALPQLPGALLVSAELARASGDLPAARTALDRAVQGLAEDAPERAALGWVRARVLLDGGDRAGASEALMVAARSLPDSSALWGAVLALAQDGTIPDLGPARLTAGPGSTR